MKKTRVGFCVTGSFCTLDRALVAMADLKGRDMEVSPIFSYIVAREDTRFFKASEFRQKVEELCGARVTDTIAGAETFGPVVKCDAMCIVPATGNTVAKLAANITDTPVVMAAKAHLRGDRPLVIAPATNDGLGANAKFIGTLLARKNIYFVPFKQDDPVKKPRSVVADFTLLYDTLASALDGRQLQPILM
jgi:dipicolinate synthase subunit B